MKKLLKSNSGRGKHFKIRLTEQEWKDFEEGYAKSTCRSHSEYARKILLEEPVNIVYRDQSFDDFEEQMTSRFLPLLEQFNDCLGQLSPSDPILLAFLQSLSKIFKDIRKLLTKLSDLCAQK